MAECTQSSASHFLYSPVVGNEIELSEDQEQSCTGRKRKCNPENWTKKHVKMTTSGRKGLRR